MHSRSLFRLIRLSMVGNDVKFVAVVTDFTAAEILSEVDTVADWVDTYKTPLSVDKCTVLHCGNHQLLNQYVILERTVKTVESFVDLGFRRTNAVGHSNHYSQQYAHVSASTVGTCGQI